jgi:aldehyde:ferredoxin oxidoreductase
MHGWKGNKLIIDLGAMSARVEKIDPQVLSRFLGGRGVNAWTLATQLPAEADPLGPENILCFGAGLLTGTTVPSSGRFNVSAKSPATNLFGDANSGGFWAPELKYAGYDQILVLGSAAEPVYVLVRDEVTEIRSAKHLWGKSVWDTERLLKEELEDESIQICSIGQAGENRVRYAAVINNLSRAAGRTGMGAVMGAKNLKAIVVKGSGGIAVADRHQLRRLNRKLLEVMYDSPSFPLRSTLGTSLLIELYNGMGVLPTRNAKESTFEGSKDISGRLLMDRYVVKPKSCFGCPVHCSHFYVVTEGPYAGTSGEGPEFETLCALGSRCGNSNLESILAANNLCNQYGLDTISTGGVIAFAMECFEKDLLKKSDTDGLELDWGNHETIIALIHKIARREGVGNLLAEGIARMADQIPGSESFALHIKGLETPEQDVRGLKSWGLGWAVSSRGADHCRAFPLAETTWKPEEAERLFGTKNAADRFSYDGKPEMVKWYEEYSAVGDALEFCRIAQLGLNMPLDLIAEIVNAVTGLEYTAESLLEVGERIVQVERIFNLNNGLKPGDDRLPTRFLEEAIASGPSKGHRYNQEKVIRKYYTLRDWDVETGWPGEKTLERLEITKKHLGIET